jgi:hypothetical protein
VCVRVAGGHVERRAAQQACHVAGVAEVPDDVGEVAQAGPIMLRVLSAGSPGCGQLFTSSRAFPRSRKNPGPLINALHAWLTDGPPAPPVTESWLLGVPDSS